MKFNVTYISGAYIQPSLENFHAFNSAWENCNCYHSAIYMIEPQSPYLSTCKINKKGYALKYC